MKRRRVFQVVVEYDTEHDTSGQPYPRFLYPRHGKVAFDPDESVTAEYIADKLTEVSDEWTTDDLAVVADVKVTEVEGDVRQLIANLIDPDDCSFDHHGGCQAHGYLSLEPGDQCPQAEAKQWLSDHPGEG